MYEVGLGLIDAGYGRLDMTPGGEDWKERFSSSRETVFELRVHTNAIGAAVARTSEFLDRRLHEIADRMDISIANVRALAQRVSAPLRPKTAAVRAEVLYALPLASARAEKDDRLRINPLRDLVTYASALGDARRQAFLSQALTRIQSGQQCFAIVGADGIAGLGWSESDSEDPDDKSPAGAKSARLSGFAVASGADAGNTYRALVEAMVSELAVRTSDGIARVAVPENDPALRAAVEALGFKRVTT
jgi:hypothetical protein